MDLSHVLFDCADETAVALRAQAAKALRRADVGELADPAHAWHAMTALTAGSGQRRSVEATERATRLLLHLPDAPPEALPGGSG